MTTQAGVQNSARGVDWDRFAASEGAGVQRTEKRLRTGDVLPNAAVGGDAAISSGRRRLLASLLLSAVIPLVLFGCWVAYIVASRDLTAAREAALETASRVAERVGSELQKELEIAQALAALPSLDGSSVDLFYREAQRITDARPLWESVVLSDRASNEVLNVPRPLPPSDPGEDRQASEKVLRLQSPVIGEIGEVGAGGKKLVLLRIPVIRNRDSKYVITVGLVPSEISKILSQAGAPQGWTGIIVDGKGKVVSRTDKEKYAAGSPASAAVRNAITHLPEGFYSDRTLDGVQVEAVYRLLPGTSGWSVHFVIPTEALNAGVSRSVLLMGGGGAASLALAAALALIIGRDLGHRRRAEEERAALALQISEERGALALEAADLGAWRWEIQGGRFIASERAIQMIDAIPAQINGTEGEWRAADVLAMVDSRDRPRLTNAIKECSETGTTMDVEFRIARPAGKTHWFRATGRALWGRDQRLPTVYGVLSDVEETKRAHSRHMELLRHLARAQETERRRIARELHDQIGQTVTGLSLGLKNLETSLKAEGCRSESWKHLRWVQGLSADVGRDLHKVAADLRPVSLDDLGLFKAVATHTAEWSRRSGIKADIQSLGHDRDLPPDVATAVYRCVQEALTNTVKHAAARSVSIVLERNAHELRVVVEDDGRGFDAARELLVASDGRPLRLGLSGMRERLALVAGTLNIESSSDVGTAIYLRVPTLENAELP